MSKLTTTDREEKSSTWESALSNAIDDIDIIGGELSWLVSDLYGKHGITGRQKQRLTGLASRAQRLLNDLAKLRTSMGLPERPE